MASVGIWAMTMTRKTIPRRHPKKLYLCQLTAVLSRSLRSNLCLNRSQKGCSPAQTIQVFFSRDLQTYPNSTCFPTKHNFPLAACNKMTNYKKTNQRDSRPKFSSRIRPISKPKATWTFETSYPFSPTGSEIFQKLNLYATIITIINMYTYVFPILKNLMWHLSTKKQFCFIIRDYVYIILFSNMKV